MIGRVVGDVHGTAAVTLRTKEIPIEFVVFSRNDYRVRLLPSIRNLPFTRSRGQVTFVSYVGRSKSPCRSRSRNRTYGISPLPIPIRHPVNTRVFSRSRTIGRQKPNTEKRLIFFLLFFFVRGTSPSVSEIFPVRGKSFNLYDRRVIVIVVSDVSDRSSATIISRERRREKTCAGPYSFRRVFFRVHHRFR